MNLKNQSGMNGTSCPSAGAKLNKIVGEVHNPNSLTNRLYSSPICRQRRRSLSFTSNTTLTSTAYFLFEKLGIRLKR